MNENVQCYKREMFPRILKMKSLNDIFPHFFLTKRIDLRSYS